MDALHPGPDGLQQESYGAEVMCSGWNPLVAVVVEPIGQVCRELLADLATVDVEGFLREFYRGQRS